MSAPAVVGLKRPANFIEEIGVLRKVAKGPVAVAASLTAVLAAAPSVAAVCARPAAVAVCTAASTLPGTATFAASAPSGPAVAAAVAALLPTAAEIQATVQPSSFWKSASLAPSSVPPSIATAAAAGGDKTEQGPPSFTGKRPPRDMKRLEKGIWYEHRLIDDMVAQAMKSDGGLQPADIRGQRSGFH